MAEYSFEDFEAAASEGGGDFTASAGLSLRDIYNGMKSLNIWVPIILVAAFVACVISKVLDGKSRDEAIEQCAKMLKSQDQSTTR